MNVGVPGPFLLLQMCLVLRLVLYEIKMINCMANTHFKGSWFLPFF